MNQWFGGLIFLMLFMASPLAGQQSVSIDAERITLGRLLRLFDRATGLHSTVPPDLANRIVSVRISGLPLEEAIRKIFETVPVDYVLISGQGIVVTQASTERAAAEEPAPVYEEEELPEISVVSSEESPASLPKPAQPPSVVPTPFGPILKSSAQNPVVQLPPVVGEAPVRPFFHPQTLPTPPAGAPNGPAENQLFRPISIY